MLISIVLPTYNGSAYIQQTIDSCLAQTYTNWELIIVDDASTDNTPHIVKTYTDPRITYIRHTENKRLPKALNTGFDQAKGALHTWISDDNYFKPEALNTLASFLQKHPHIDVVYSNFTTIDKAGKPLKTIYVEPPETLLFKNNIGASFMYRNHVHKTNQGYDEQTFLGEDYDFWLRAYKTYAFASIPDNIYCYRTHENSLSSMHSQKVLKLLAHITEKHLPSITHLPKKTIATAYWELSKAHFRYNNPINKSLKCACKAIIKRPIIMRKKENISFFFSILKAFFKDKKQ